MAGKRSKQRDPTTPKREAREQTSGAQGPRLDGKRRSETRTKGRGNSGNETQESRRDKMHGKTKGEQVDTREKTVQVTAQTTDSQWMADDKDEAYKRTHRRDKAVDAEKRIGADSAGRDTKEKSRKKGRKNEMSDCTLVCHLHCITQARTRPCSRGCAQTLSIGSTFQISGRGRKEKLGDVEG